MAAADPVSLLKMVLERGRAERLKPPYVVCLCNPDGAVRVFRLNEDGSGGILAEGGLSSEPERPFTAALVLDQSGEVRGWSSSAPRTPAPQSSSPKPPATK